MSYGDTPLDRFERLILSFRTDLFIQAQMSNAELSLLFYNCISTLEQDASKKHKFYHKIEQYNFLQNIPEDCLSEDQTSSCIQRPVFGS